MKIILGLLGILLLPGLGSILSLLVGKKSEKLRDIINIVITGLVFIFVSLLYIPVCKNTIELYIPHIMGIGLYLKLDLFRYVFVWITALIWFMTTIYSIKYLLKSKNRNRYYSIWMLTLSSTIGIFLSENLLNLFTFFEIMSLVSYTLVIHDEDRYTHEAGKTYLIMSLAGGLILLMGVFLLYDYTATLNISALALIMPYVGNVKYIISILIIIGFGIKASMVPFHIWLPKAYSAAPSPATAVLSAILAKTGVFGIIITVNIMMKGDLIISSVVMSLGLTNMLIGGFLAIFQRNIKRILAYSSMSQIGYILMGIGLIGIIGDHSPVAVYGTIYHVINHAIYKGLLFLATGVIYMHLHELSINKIRGFGTHRIILKTFFLIGMLGIMGIPGFNGYTSKILLHEALIEAHHIYETGWFTIAEIILIISSSFTVTYMLKIFIGVFIHNNNSFPQTKTRYIQKHTLYPFVVLSSLIILIGLKPDYTLNIINGSLFLFNINEPTIIEFYSLNNIFSVIITFLLGVTLYFILIKKYLIKKANDQITYVNPSLYWFNAERDIYIPLFNFLYDIVLIILWYTDIAMLNIIETINKWINMVSKIKINNIKPKNKEFKQTKIRKSKEELEKNEKIFNFINTVRLNMNSIMYSIFIFAVMLVFVLIGLMN